MVTHCALAPAAQPVEAVERIAETRLQIVLMRADLPKRGSGIIL